MVQEDISRSRLITDSDLIRDKKDRVHVYHSCKSQYTFNCFKLACIRKKRKLDWSFSNSFFVSVKDERALLRFRAQSFSWQTSEKEHFTTASLVSIETIFLRKFIY